MIVKDEFPVGMRVLAVDDDSTCLMVLTNLLRKCQYHVTPVNAAIKALELLRNNKDKFDLVITDVDMPEMDGFTLLQYVGREMDLPVILLSSYSDTELVMKGITHGACDYLLKPVRVEELKNIWQHVVRNKNLNRKERKPSNEEVKATEDVNKCIKPNKRRKEQNNIVENPQKEDSSTQKKSRLVWTPDLHRKFVAAVNKLGVDKAVPKKILELMKDERCTRENIASHLQKYRLYLKNYSGVANRQATKVRPFASVDSARGASAQNVCRSYPNASGFDNIPFGLCGPSSSGTIQWNQIDNSRSSFNHDLHMFDEMPMPLDYSTMNLDSLANTVTTVFSELNVNGARNCGFANSMLMLEEEHDLMNIAPVVPNFEDNWQEQDTTTSDLGGSVLNSATQVIINPNREVSFLSSTTFNALADVKTLNIICREFSPQQNQAFFPGDTSLLVYPPTIHHLSCEEHEFRVNDELLNSGENDL